MTKSKAKAQSTKNRAVDDMLNMLLIPQMCKVLFSSKKQEDNDILWTSLMMEAISRGQLKAVVALLYLENFDTNLYVNWNKYNGVYLPIAVLQLCGPKVNNKAEMTKEKVMTEICAITFFLDKRVDFTPMLFEALKQGRHDFILWFVKDRSDALQLEARAIDEGGIWSTIFDILEITSKHDERDAEVLAALTKLKKPLEVKIQVDVVETK